MNEPISFQIKDHENLKQNYISHLMNEIPEFNSLGISEMDNLVSENLLSPIQIPLSKELLYKIQSIIKSFYRLRENQRYHDFHKKEILDRNIIDPLNKSMFMSFDFHLDQMHNPKIIEVNTNAAFLGLGYYLYETLKLDNGTGFNIQELKKNILSELELQSKKINYPKILIIDEEPKNQRLYIEFLLYKHLFNQFGFQTEIVHFQDFQKFPCDFIYNRYTDFYLDNEKSQTLKEKFLDKSICFSPNPFEYLLMADKKRLSEWSQDSFWEFIADSIPHEDATNIKSTVPKSFLFKDLDKSQIWENRKNLFFKPINSFGSKQTYKAASISRRLFDEMDSTVFMAQEYISAPEISVETPDGIQKFKYDLRCYCYQDQLQMVIARTYQGQMTNLKTKWGGFSPIKWI